MSVQGGDIDAGGIGGWAYGRCCPSTDVDLELMHWRCRSKPNGTAEGEVGVSIFWACNGATQKRERDGLSFTGKG